MIANYHTHTWRCHHATGTEESYVRTAIESGIRTLGFSDHTPYYFEGDYYSDFRMRPEELPAYVATVLDLKEKYKAQIEIRLGLELEYYPAFLPKTLPYLKEWGIEYLLLGQHHIGNEINDPYSGALTRDPAVLKQYVRQSIEAMNTGLFTYLAHPDLIRFVGDDVLYRQEMRTLCREIRRIGFPLEINLLGIADHRHYPNPVFWEIAAEEGNHVVIGVDAHFPEALSDADSKQKARDMVAHYGFTLIENVPLQILK